jgi:hypothetical protein
VVLKIYRWFLATVIILANLALLWSMYSAPLGVYWYEELFSGIIPWLIMWCIIPVMAILGGKDEP